MAKAVTEGLLYKKIQSIMNQSWGDVKSTRPLTNEERVYMLPPDDDGEYYTEYVVEKDEQIKQVLDEAKQDFPKCENCNENQPMKPCSFIAYASDFPQFTICTPLKEWFEKWFGDAEK